MRFVLKYTWVMGFYGDYKEATAYFPSRDHMEAQVEAMQEDDNKVKFGYYAADIRMYEIKNGQMVRL